ncbi:glycosyl hydrolase [Elsinoe ampelina]|uniref:Glycosyl hydrolase n=1 Tax=Elsinoe ampelina TaxID=302913 RepID=A0A6A6GCK6_9PEZI|nr:glycosyl hydrolase [Elsinoe ampelina]
MSFKNPVIRGFNPDPTVCVVPGDGGDTPTTYFLSTSTFEYFPGCPIYSSTDLINWRLIGHALTRRSQIELRTVEPGAGAWASTLRYRIKEKRWYLTTGVFQRYRPSSDERIFPRGFYVHTDNIYDSTTWSDPIYFDNPGFDQDLFWDDNDKVYLSTTVRMADRDPASKLKDFAIHISEIDLPSGRTLTPPVVLRQSPFGVAEGSHIIKREGWYYLFTAEGGTEAGHQEWVFRSRDGPLGPWEGQGKGLWYNGPEEEVQRTGHADVFQDGEGEWWGVFLGVRPVKEGGKWLEPQLGRETFLVKVEWRDGWPVFNGGRNVTLETEGRGEVRQEIERVRKGEAKWRADMSGGELELGWYQKGTPLKQCYDLEARPGYLRMYGNCYGLSSPEAPAMLLRKQSEYTDSFHAKMQFSPSRPGYEAGVVLWWNQFSYATIGLTKLRGTMDPSELVIASESPSGEAGVHAREVRSLSSDQASKTLDLSIHASTTSYLLQAHIEGTLVHAVEVAASQLTLMPPVGGSFCGIMFGIYSSGDSEPVLDPADFSDIIIKQG